MKNVIKTIRKSILLVTVFTTMLSSANEISTLISKEDLKRTALTIDNVREGDLLSIKNQNGIVIYKELIDFSGTYKKGFDLTALPNGSYFFEIDKEIEIKTIPFTVDSSIVAFDKSKEVITFKPYVNRKDDLVLISKLAPDLEPLSIDVYSKSNDDYNLVHSEEISGTQNIERVFKLRKGEYKFVFIFNDREYTKFINN